MISYILYGLIYGIIAAFIVGSSFFMMVHMSTKQWFRKALAFVIGVNIVDPIIAAISYYTMTYVFEGIPLINIELRGYIAAAISWIMWIFMIINRVSLTKTASSMHEWLWYLYAFTKWVIVQWTNIFAWIVGLAVASYFILNDTTQGFVRFVWTVFTIVLIGDIIKIYYANKISRNLQPKTLKLIQRSLWIILIGLGIFIRYRTGICAKDMDMCLQETQQQLEKLFDKETINETGNILIP